MRSFIWVTIFLLLAVFAASPALLARIYFYTEDLFLSTRDVFIGFIEEPKPTVNEVRFVGDIMLARHVETLMNKEGSDYPYRNIDSEENVAWVGNFEATVPDKHQPTEPFTLNFSVDPKHLTALRDFGVTHLSLANNHSLDFGREGLVETKHNLSDFNVFGHPASVSSASIGYVDLNNGRLGIMAINAVGKQPDEEDLKRILHKLTLETDAQVAYIHWGDEYSKTHNEAQEKLAHRLIDGGIDAVIGHHPHVVQDIGTYNGKPIFYSLGNFIFDQYFDESVLEGLVVAITLSDDEIDYQLLPVSSAKTLSSPSFMTDAETNQFLSDLAAVSSPRIRSKILDGRISLWREW